MKPGVSARALMLAVVVALAVALASGCPPGPSCTGKEARTITVGSDACDAPCTADFGEVTVPLSEQRRIAFTAPEGCELFGFFQLGEGDDFDGVSGPFTIAEEGNAGARAVFAQVQFAPTEEGESRAKLELIDDFGDTPDEVELVGRGTVP